jgi:hypothetical protein
MNGFSIEDGELLAYLAGEDLPYVAQALQQSPELQHELETLRRTSGLFTQLFDGLEHPDPQDMVDVLTGQASHAQQLRVAAYVRQSAVGQAGYQALEEELRRLTPAHPSRRRKLPEFFAVPQGAVAGLRAAPRADDRDQTFVVAELQAQVTLRMAPRAGEWWAIEGYITRQQQPVAGVQVRLTATTARPRPRTTDAAGFFSFPKLREGTYQLRATFDDGMIIISGLALYDE